ncbi:MAG: hypothetical protein AAFX87_29115 [Bacteroidota bacterium]
MNKSIEEFKSNLSAKDKQLIKAGNTNANTAANYYLNEQKSVVIWC